MSSAALIYSHSVSPRLQYIAEFLSDYYGLHFQLVYDEQKFIQSKDVCKINYSYHRLTENEIFIHSHALLFESSVRPVKTECFAHRESIAFFKSEGDVGFDLFAAVFFLITRYEEYLPHRKDAYGRYDHAQSTAYQNQFLNKPLVNIWLEDFRHLLIAGNAAFALSARKFSFLPTYDIDMAWVYRNKGRLRTAGGLMLMLLKGKFRGLIQRYRVAGKKKQDPYDVYEWLNGLHHKYALHPVYFFLVAKDKGKYDRNISIRNEEQQQLIRSIARGNETGLHPSWASGDHPQLLGKEKGWLEKITERKIHKSRQHFIRFHLPDTYYQLLKHGLVNEYSMGYGTVNGFRASVASSYYWYDLKREEKTALRIHPFCFMDANAFYEEGKNAEEAFAELMTFYREVIAVHGQMITIWHNSFLGTLREFAGWRETYERFIQTISASES